MPPESERRFGSRTEIRWQEFPGTSASAFLAAFERLRARPLPWLLDSALEQGGLGRFSFAGADPYLVLRSFGRRIEIDCRRAVRAELPTGCRRESGDALQWARALMPAAPGTDWPRLPFLGGAVGILGYELAESAEAIELHAHDDLCLPDLCLLFVDRLLAFDARTGVAWALGMGFGETRAEAEERAQTALRSQAALVQQQAPIEQQAPVSQTASSPSRARSTRPPAARPASGSARRRRLLTTPTPEGLHCSLSRGAYLERVGTLLEEIACGNVYEANLTQRMSLECAADPWSVYLELREQNPAPFAAYLELPDGSVLSSSPERFLRLSTGGEAESRPIKGTRPRGMNAVDDAKLARDLSESAKDRAENLMIVDLVRNDLGRVCKIGSVQVPELMCVEPYASVFQLVSTVRGQLRPDRDAFDLIRASFPPGSMTGAPKIAAMRLIDELETIRRGIYAGALGYLDVRGGMDLAVVIRTILIREGMAHLHAGGAIVADSDPDQEYRETFSKAQALFAALAAGGCRRADSGNPGSAP